MEEYLNKKFAKQNQPSEGMPARKQFIECNAEYNIYRTMMIFATRGHNAPSQLSNKRRKQFHHPMVVGATSETGQAISNKLHNDLETLMHPEHLVPFM